MTTRVLVTGGCGFVGAPLVRDLVRRGIGTLAYDDLSRGDEAAIAAELLSGGARVVVGDIRDQERLGAAIAEFAPHAVVHLAALHFIPHCDADPARCLSINVQGTQAVLASLSRARPTPALVYASTAAVYAPDSRPHDELASRVAPTDVYGFSKLAGEQLVQAFADTTGAAVSIGRLFNVFGPGETNPHLIPAILAQAATGTELRLGDLSTRRDYVFTDDVARGLHLLADAALGGEPALCNLGTGTSRSGEEVVAAVGKLLGKELVVRRDDGRIRQSDRPVLSAAVDRAERLLGWTPTVPFEEGLEAAARQPLTPKTAAA